MYTIDEVANADKLPGPDTREELIAVVDNLFKQQQVFAGHVVRK